VTQAQSAFTAAYMGELAISPAILDDREYGFPGFIGTSRWEPDRILQGLGREWLSGAAFASVGFCGKA
jgi:hypothetical protein